MEIVVIADSAAQTEFIDKGISQNVQVQFVQSINEITKEPSAFFFLLPENNLKENISSIKKLKAPVFVHSVYTTLNDLPSNCIRINAWPGFLLHTSVEICAADVNKNNADKILNSLGWSYHYVPDISGMIAARVIAMIINEAYFALEEEVSTKKEIDIAMKLGTNYPYGPFEWSEKIGLINIFLLLKQLSYKDKRYSASELLTAEAE